jgi:hypothetical protein
MPLADFFFFIFEVLMALNDKVAVFWDVTPVVDR